MSSRNKHTNPFLNAITNSDRQTIYAVAVLLVVVLVLTIKAEVTGLIVSSSMILAIPLLLFIFYQPKKSLTFLFAMCFLIIGLTRYLPIPLGLTVDFLLVLLYLSLFFKFFKRP